MRNRPIEFQGTPSSLIWKVPSKILTYNREIVVPFSYEVVFVKDGLILENASGKLIISKESLDNLIYNAAKDIPGADNISSKTYLDLEQNLRVFVTVSMTQDVSIKELSTALQSKIKTAIKQTADLEVSEVNVKIKNIVNKKTRKIKDNYTEKAVEPTVNEVAENNIEENKIEE